MVLLLFGVQVAFADNWGSNHASGNTSAHPCDTTLFSQCVDDNNSDAILFVGTVAQSHKDAINWSIANYNSVAPAIFMYISTLPPNLVDVQVKDQTAGMNGAWAWGACDVAASYGGTDPKRWCKPEILTWNLSYEATKYPTTTNKRDVACHELGHTMGLRHTVDSTSCMVNASQFTTTTSTDDRNDLTVNYP